MRSIAANSFAVSSYQQKASPSPVRNTPPVTSDQFSLTAKTIKAVENHIPKFGMNPEQFAKYKSTIDWSHRNKANNYQGPVNATAKVDIDRVRYQEDTGEAADRAKLAASSGTTTKKKKKKK